MEVILDFSTVRGTKPRILTPKRYDDHPRHYTRTRAVDSKTIRNCLCVGSLYKRTQSLNERSGAIRKWNVEFEPVEGQRARIHVGAFEPHKFSLSAIRIPFHEKWTGFAVYWDR